MTRSAYRNNIKPMLFSVTFVVMIVLCLFATRTSKVIGTSQFTISDSVVNCIYSLNLQFILSLILFSVSTYCFFPFFSLGIFFAMVIVQLSSFFGLRIFFVSATMCLLAFFCLGIFLYSFATAGFTGRMKVIFGRFIFIKFRWRLKFFASTTSFRYDYFRRNLSPVKIMLEPVVGYTPAVGSFYYSRTNDK